MLCGKIELYLFCLLLTKAVTTFPTYKYSSCNCVLLQTCEVFNTFIDNSSNEAHVRSVIQKAVCSFDGLRIFVCCPDNLNRPKLDYLDELTGLNCPPSFGNEYNYDEYLKTQHYGLHSFNSNNKHNHVENHDQIIPVDCNGFGNCGPLKRPYNNGNTAHHSHDNHHHHHNSYNIHDSDFAHTHTNRDKLDYPIDEIIAKPTGKKDDNCGILNTVFENSVQVYPWITRLAYLNTTSRTIRYRCMGTIISGQHIVTAAHCVHQLVSDLRFIYVRIGDDVNFDDYQVLETIIHPNYNEPQFNNDVALLKLAITSQHKGPLKRICLPQNITNMLSGKTGVVAGWSSGGVPEVRSSAIRYINLPIMNNTECAIDYAKYSENFETSIVITPTEFCAKAPVMKDVCEGDSGGPFMERSKSARYTLLGIVAFGPKTNCGESNLPGVYMRVSSYVDWIKSNIK